MATEHQLVARIPIEMRQELEQLAQEDDRSISYHVRQAIREYLHKKAYEERLRRAGKA